MRSTSCGCSPILVLFWKLRSGICRRDVCTATLPPPDPGSPRRRSGPRTPRARSCRRSSTRRPSACARCARRLASPLEKGRGAAEACVAHSGKSFVEGFRVALNSSVLVTSRDGKHTWLALPKSREPSRLGASGGGRGAVRCREEHRRACGGLRRRARHGQQHQGRGDAHRPAGDGDVSG